MTLVLLLLLCLYVASPSLHQGAGLGTDEGSYGVSVKGEAVDCAVVALVGVDVL